MYIQAYDQNCNLIRPDVIRAKIFSAIQRGEKVVLDFIQLTQEVSAQWIFKILNGFESALNGRIAIHARYQVTETFEFCLNYLGRTLRYEIWDRTEAHYRRERNYRQFVKASTQAHGRR